MTTNPELGGAGISTGETSARLDESTRALKERIYASFTGLAILGALYANGHATAPEALLSVAVGVFGISVAGFLAEVVAHLVTHQALPSTAEVRTMGRIALAALGSASLPLLVLALSWAGLLSLEVALWIGMGIYTATLVLVMLARRPQRRPDAPVQRLVASAMLIGLALFVAAVLRLLPPTCTDLSCWASRCRPRRDRRNRGGS